MDEQHKNLRSLKKQKQMLYAEQSEKIRQILERDEQMIRRMTEKEGQDELQEAIRMIQRGLDIAFMAVTDG